MTSVTRSRLFVPLRPSLPDLRLRVFEEKCVCPYVRVLENAEGFELLTFDEVQGLLRLSRNTLKKYIASGDIPSVKLGRQYRFRRCEIERIMRDGFRERPDPS